MTEVFDSLIILCSVLLSLIGIFYDLPLTWGPEIDILDNKKMIYLSLFSLILLNIWKPYFM